MGYYKNIGRGKNFSIAKAALIVYYEEIAPDWDDAFLDYGDLNVIHRIVDVAGAQHCSVVTHNQVTSCLRNSPYWNNKFCPGFYSGMRGHGGASLFTPSQKGEDYYHNILKERDDGKEVNKETT